jgi:hypothetical protein
MDPMGMVVSLCFLQVFPQAARRFRAPVPQVDPETQAAIEAAKEAQQAAAKANGGGCGASWIRLGEKSLVKKSPIRGSRIYPTYIIYPNVPRRHGPIHHWEGTAMQNIEISQLFPRQTYV